MSAVARVQTPTREQALADRLAEHIKRVVAEAPPLSSEQKSRLALLLGPVT